MISGNVMSGGNPLIKILWVRRIFSMHQFEKSYQHSEISFIREKTVD
jgi:hypothetical protein